MMSANLNDMTVSQLRKLAAQFNISGRSTMKKAELIEALSASEVAGLVELTVTVDEMEETPAPVAETPASDHNPDTAGLPAAFDITETKPQRVYSVPVHGVRVEMERTAPGRATAELSTNEAGISRSIPVVKNGRTWELVDHRNGVLIVVKARTFSKLAKRWAKKLGVWADDIRIINAV